MRQQGMNVEMAASGTVTVLPTDTLLCALRVMKEHQVSLLPVMEETGALVGLIHETHILEAWEEDPLRYVSEVMAECGPPEEEEERAEGMRLPLVLEWECGERAYVI
jgi:predicted transcriptional regulator